MDFRGQEVDFQGADRRYEELKRQRDAGSISEEEFDEQLKNLMVQDESGRWWVKSRKSGEWHYNDGSSWIVGTPLGYAPPSGSDQNEGKRNLTVDGVALSRAEIPWGRILLIAGLVLMVLIVVVLLVVGVGPYLPAATLGRDFLKGKTLSEAAQTVGTDYGLEVRSTTPYTSQPKGTIAETPQPYRDEPAPRGSVIPLWISSGKEDVTVPDVTGMSVLQASKTLLDEGLHAKASGEDGWIRMRLDQNGQPMAATLHADLDDKPGAVGEDVSQRTVTKAELSGSSEPAAGSKTEAGTLIFLEYS